MNIRNRKAFTIIELIVVIAVIGILVLLAMPRFLGYVEKSQVTVIRHDVKVAEGKMAELLMNGPGELNSWEDNNKDLDLLVEQRKLYETEGLVKKVEDGGGVEYGETEDFTDYKIIPKSMKQEIGTKLKGTFYTNLGGKVYYERDKAAKADKPEKEKDKLKANGCPIDSYDGYIPVDMDEEFKSKIQGVNSPNGEIPFFDFLETQPEDFTITFAGFKKNDDYFLLLNVIFETYEDIDTGNYYEIGQKMFIKAENVGDIFMGGPYSPNVNENTFNAVLQITENGEILSKEEIEDVFGDKFEGEVEPIGNLSLPKYIPTYDIDGKILNCSVNIKSEDDTPLECGLMIQFDLDLNTLISIPIADSKPDDEEFHTITLEEFMYEFRLPEGAVVANYKFKGETYLYIQTKGRTGSEKYEESALVVKPQEFHKLVLDFLDDEEYYEYSYEEYDGIKGGAYGNIDLLPQCITQMDENGKMIGKPSIIKFRGNTTPDIINTSCSMNIVEFTGEMVDFVKQEDYRYWTTVNAFEYNGKKYITFMNINKDYSDIEEGKSNTQTESTIEYGENTKYFSMRDINNLTIYNWTDKNYLVTDWNYSHGNWNKNIPLPTCYKNTTIVEPDLGKIVSYLDGTTLYVLRELSPEVINYNLNPTQLWEEIEWNPITPSDGEMAKFDWGSNGDKLELITKVIIGDNIINVGKYAFSYGENIEEIVIGKDVVDIEEYAFAYMNLKNVNIPDSVITIGNNSFPNNKITELNFGKNVETIGGGAFSGHELTEIVIPNSVKKIEHYAFDAQYSDNANLVSLTIGNSVTEIGEYAFRENKLETIVIGEGVNIIDKAFIDGLILKAGLEFKASYAKEYKSAGKYLFTSSGWYKEGNPIPEQMNPPAPGYIPVANADELNNIRKNEINIFGAGTEYEGNYLGGLDKKYMQVADIDLINYQSGLGWEPIGVKDNPFTGEYIGTKAGNSKYKISNLKINRPEIADKGRDVGLFGEISNSKIMDLELINVDTRGYVYTGSLAGSIARSSTVTGVSSSGIVEGKDNAGGLAGYSSGTISNSSFTGVVKGTDTTGTGKYVGGLLGTSYGNVSRCFAKVDISGFRPHSLGGLIGTNSKTVSNSYVIGSVKGNNSSTAAGIVGLNSAYGDGVIQNSYASVTMSGQIYGDKYGVLGNNAGGKKNSNSYFDKTKSGNDFGGPNNTFEKFVGKTNSELMSGTPLPGFNSYWIFEAGRYPRLSWE